MTENIHVIELEHYESPKIVEDKSKDWVLYGKDNSYYDYLIDCRKNSTTNGTVINNISRLIYGKGLSALDASLKANEYASLINIFPKKDLRRVCDDLKAMGQCAFQVHYTTKGERKVSKAYHMPIKRIAPNKCNEEGEITHYFYCDDWSDTKKFVPKPYPAFGTSSEEIEIMFIHGLVNLDEKYYSVVDYNGALPYAYMEKQIADYLINDIDNGFSGTKVINFNNGIPDEEKQQLQANKVNSKLKGSKGLKTIVSFNNDETKKTTVDDIPLNDAPEHYTYLSDEARNKLLAGHNVISSMLVGIAKEGQGFASTADEIEISAIYFYNTVIKAFQEIIIDAIDQILAVNKISLDLYFKRLNLLEDIEKELQQKEQQNEQQVTLSKLDNETSDKLISFADEINLDEYELVDARPVDYDSEVELDKAINKANNPTMLQRIMFSVSTGTAYPKRRSEQDGELFVSRYRYMGDIKANSREFCKAMIKANKLYRKEDIIAMGDLPVNEGWGPRGADTYSIWLYKGGGDCGHYWQRETYRKKGTDISSPLAKQVTASEARKAGEILPANPNKVYTKPKDMPNNGFLPK